MFPPNFYQIYKSYLEVRQLSVQCSSALSAISLVGREVPQRAAPILFNLYTRDQHTVYSILSLVTAADDKAILVLHHEPIQTTEASVAGFKSSSTRYGPGAKSGDSKLTYRNSYTARKSVGENPRLVPHSTTNNLSQPVVYLWRRGVFRTLPMTNS